MNRALRLNIVSGALGMFWLCAPLGAPLPLLMQAVNASSTQLGILSAAWQIAMLAQIPAAFIAESMKRRKPFWAIVTTLHRILWASPALLPWLFPDNRELWPVFLIAALGLSNLLANSGTASWLSWMADLVPPESAGRFWALRQLVLSLSMIVCTALYGWLLDHYAATDSPFLGFQWVFALCSLLGIADIAVHCFVHEPEHRRTQERKTCRERFASPFRNRGFTVLTAAMAGWVGAQSALGYTMGVPGFFSMVHLREAFGASYSQASMVFIAACVGAALFTPWLGSWMDRAGSQNVLTRLVFLGPISMAAWWIAKPGTWNLVGFALPAATTWMVFAALFQGAIYTGTLLCQLRLSQIYTPKEGRTLAMALHWSISGVGGALGAMGAGFLKDALPTGPLSWLPGQWHAFDLLVLLHALVAWVLVLPLMRILQNEPAPEPAEQSPATAM